MSKRVTFFVISGDAGKVRRVSVSKTVIRTLLLMVVLFFSFTCFMIYDYRTSISDRIELTNLREVASEQQFMLSFFEDKFQRLEAEVSRLRVIDTRIKELIKIQRPERKGKKTYIGGTEEEGTKAFLRDKQIVELRFEELEKGVLVNLQNLHDIKDMLEFRLEVLESLPSVWPLRGVVSSGFGVRISPFTKRTVFHRGLDIKAPAGLEILASGSGKVIQCGYNPDFGNVVKIDHGYGYKTTYAHLSEILVKPGELIDKGRIIGRVGSTGKSTGPHLHFEIRVNGVPVNPIRYLG
ncbi:MAG: M23 family metallopeptidase [Deltaproteobacteria bacterium]|nr:M23 family metallopeptidase [Deltaproteobacteria bacterium]